MKIDIRENIINNFKDSDLNEINSCIEDSINKNDEITLPGLGVFFELLWKNCDKNDKDFILKTIKKSL